MSWQQRVVLVGFLALSGCYEPQESRPVAPPASNPPPPVKMPLEDPAVVVTVRSSEDGQPFPSRMLVTPVGNTKVPDFGSNGQVGYEYAQSVIGAYHSVLLVTGHARVPLAAGTYDLTLMQGPEYEWVRRRVTVPDHQIVPIDETLEHVVRTDGWLAADMHIHTKVSGDSRVMQHHRVVAEVTSGVEVIVPTEHGVHNDLQPQVLELGYERRAVSIPGSEYGFEPGHAGVYPVVYQPKAKFFGALDWQEWPMPRYVPPQMGFPQVHAMPGKPLIVINHPRMPPDLGYFLNIHWPAVPGEPLATVGLFDGMELLNGYEHDPHEISDLLQDWFYFLNQSQHIVALGNSDTHTIDWITSGYPRSWLHLATDEPSRVLPDDLRTGLAEGRAVASNGPFVNLQVDSHDIGDMVVPTAGKVTVKITADAPSWIDLDTVLLYRNGELVAHLPITKRAHPAFSSELVIPVAADGWLVAAAVGHVPLPVEVIGASKGGAAQPFAITNPVWVDVDGDGSIKPPGGAPMPNPFGLAAVRHVSERYDRGSLLGQPQHAPLDCEPQDWPQWLY